MFLLGLKAAWGWLKRNWKWLLFPIGLLLFLVGRFTKKTREVEVVSPELHEHDKKKEDLEKKLQDDLKDVAEEKAEKIAEIEEAHAKTIESLTIDQKHKVDELRGDPEKLTAYLLSVGKDIRGGQ